MRCTFFAFAGLERQDVVLVKDHWAAESTGRPRFGVDGRAVLVGAICLMAGVLLGPVLTSGADASAGPLVHVECPEAAATVVTPAAPATALASSRTADGQAALAATPAPALGQSIGTPRRGWLNAATRMLDGDGFRVRNPARAYGTEATVRHLQQAIAKVRRRHHVHRLGIGDLSDEVGGLLMGHFTHQSGRDVDLGFYYRRIPFGYPKRFTRATRDNLHFKGTWALIEALADTAEQPDGVQYIVLDYRVQRMLYHFARAARVDEQELAKVFQYPHGPGSDVGILRHFPGHDNHMHVRFKCPPTDAYCRDPAGPDDGPTWHASRDAGLQAP